MQFDYVRPQSWAEAARLMAQPGAFAKMGGCDLLTRHRRGKLEAKLVVGLDRLPDGGMISIGKDRFQIGHAVTLDQLSRNASFRKQYPLFAGLLARIASPALRASGSVVGNVAQGWSVGDVVPLLQIYDAELVVRSDARERKISVADFAAKPGSQCLNAGELISCLEIPIPETKFSVAYERFCFRNTFDLPLISVAIGAEAGKKRARVCCVGAATMPARVPEAEAAIDDGEFGKTDVEAAIAVIKSSATPVSDHLASAEYRRHVLGVVAARAFGQLVS